MRGADAFNETACTVQHLDDFVPRHHPLRAIRQMVNEARVLMDGLLSFVRKDGSDEPGSGGSFKGQTRGNETHQSTTDADARPGAR